jgi:glycogen operon protein
LPKLATSAGVRLPLGATVQEGGVNFAVFSPRATRVWLRLYRGAADAKPAAELELDAATHRTYGFWHVFVAGARAGWFYTWRADGPNEPTAGLRFDARRELLDPQARLVSDAVWDREASIDGDPAAAFRAEIAAADDYDWGGDEPLRRPLQDAVIYELHVAGYTRHPSAGVENPGTFQGLVEKIPHLKALGITDVELLPVFAFDEQDVPAATAALGLDNFWGYSPVSFFAPHGQYAASGDARREFRDMVKALHAAGIGVILDVVLNHTAEGSAEGPTISYKGLVNELFYLLDPLDRSKYLDFTGCGNTVSSNQALVAQWLVEILRFWAVEMHVDGFRFDLAGVLSRDEQGKPLAHAPVISAIELAPELRDVHLIAEAWDAGGIYQVGSFPGFKWAEWNDRYRNVVRRFLRGDPGHLGEIALAANDLERERLLLANVFAVIADLKRKIGSEFAADALTNDILAEFGPTE